MESANFNSVLKT